MLAHEPVAMWEVLLAFCMPLLCMYILRSLVLIYQVLWYCRVCSNHWLVTPVSLPSVYPWVVAFSEA
jgi:hypothetical protein